ncbi:MAG TPA: ankyrin repeat domain-containing protein [Thermoanaerobaculia bacterium]|jgi:ankyrin repeat protein
MEIAAEHPLAQAVVSAIRSGDVDGLRNLLMAHPDLARATIVDGKGIRRTLLHIVTDWPAHFPKAAATVATLIAAGADPDAVVRVPGHDEMAETALHWAASSDDVEAIDALLDGGANIEAPGAIFTGGTAMSDAVVFAQWNAARRLLERGARTTLWQAAALGLTDRLAGYFAEAASPSSHDVTNALWHACRGGQPEAADYLLARGADLNWIGHDHKTPLDAAEESGAEQLVEWLRARGGKTALDISTFLR